MATQAKKKPKDKHKSSDADHYPNLAAEVGNMKEGENAVLYESTPDQRGQVIRCTVSPYKGKMYARIGHWYRDGNELKPGKGISVPFDEEGIRHFSRSSLRLCKLLDAMENMEEE